MIKWIKEKKIKGGVDEKNEKRIPIWRAWRMEAFFIRFAREPVLLTKQP